MTIHRVLALLLLVGPRLTAAQATPGQPPVPPATRWPAATAIGVFAPERVNATKVEATSDGWVVITPLTSWTDARERYLPGRLIVSAADARAWADGIREVLDAPLDTLAKDREPLHFPQLGRGRSNIVGWRDTRPTAVGHLVFELNDCERTGNGYHMDDPTLRQIADLVEKAARVASEAREEPRPPTLARPYWASEVTCPVMPGADNARPRWPAGVRAGRSVSVGVRFVVDTSGRVEPRSITTLAGVPGAFARAARGSVASWHFAPATWTDLPVRQVVHVVLTFDPGARPDQALLRDTEWGRPEPRVLLDPENDGTVRVAEGLWGSLGRFGGARGWFPPDSLDRFLKVARARMQEDSVAPRIWHPPYNFPGVGVGIGREAMLLAGYPPFRIARDSFSAPDSVMHLHASVISQCTAAWYYGEPLDAAMLRRLRAAARAARQRRRKPLADDPMRVHDASDVGCVATLAPFMPRDTRFPGVGIMRLGPYPAAMAESNARAEVMASFIVDTTGHAEPGSLVVLGGADPRAAAALADRIDGFDFEPATRGGRRVRQRMIRTWVFLPPPRCARGDEGLECPRRYDR